MKTKNKIIAIILVAIFIFSLFAAYVEISKKEKPRDEQPDGPVFDNRISPNINQGLMVEISRIRNRGLMDKMLVVGTSWRNTPSFYWVAVVDGKECDTQGYVGKNGVYNEWDTITKNSFVSFSIEQEQEKSEVIITIMEQVKTGLLGRKTKDVEKEKINLVYDYKTGRWIGDDKFGDKEGYGHYLGKNYEIWFNLYQADYDHDGIPYWSEVNVLGTNPIADDSDLDPDNDGIPTSWEWKWGYDPFVWDDHKNLDPDIDRIENVEEYQMRKYFADPFQPDIYIETDGMQKNKIIEFQHIFYKESQQMIIERFAQHGINVYIDDGWPDGPVNGGGEMLPFYEDLDDVVGKQGLSFYLHNFADERKGIFRYLVVGNKAGFIHPSYYNAMDTIIIGSNSKSILITYNAFSQRYLRVRIAKLALHELGHSIGLTPITFPGNDIQPKSLGDRYPSMDEEEYNKYLEEYHSIMNYNFIGKDRTLFDYSDGSNGPPYDQNDWLYIYLPTFELDALNYEEPVDESFEDFEIVNNYPGIVLDGWKYDGELTRRHQNEFQKIAIVKNTDFNISIYVKTEQNDENQMNIRVYAMPNVYPVHAVWSLVAEGYIDNENNIQFYSLENKIDQAMQQISEMENNGRN